MTEPETVLDQLASVLGVTPIPGSGLLDVVVRALGRRRVLLVLDNCEQVASAVAEVVGGLLAATTGPHVLATSRVRLRVEGEQLWHVPPLSLPRDAASADDAVASDAVRLFVERGRAVVPAFALDGASGATVGEICRRLDGLSLAIEMAAARLAILSPEEIARHLDDRLRAPGAPDRRPADAASDDGGVHRRQLRAPVRGTSRSCSSASRPSPARSTSTRPVRLASASRRRPPGCWPPWTTLVEASMLAVERDGARTTYRLLETLREYSLARLRRRGVEDDVRLAHARHYLGLAEKAGAALGTPARGDTGWSGSPRTTGS